MTRLWAGDLRNNGLFLGRNNKMFSSPKYQFHPISYPVGTTRFLRG
jgi:hypothetical protein